MLWILILALVSMVGAHKDIYDPDNEITCEPTWLNKNELHFARQYNITKNGYFEMRHVHISDHIYKGVDFYRVAVSIKRTLKFEPLRSHSATLFYNFHYGDTARCHQFNPVTGEYTLTSVGFHSLKFVCVFKPGNLYTIDFEKHRKESFAFMSPVIVGERGPFHYASKEEALNLFPQHAEIVEEIYARAETTD